MDAGPYGDLLLRAAEYDADIQIGLTVSADGMPSDEHVALHILHDERGKFEQEQDRQHPK